MKRTHHRRTDRRSVCRLRRLLPRPSTGAALGRVAMCDRKVANFLLGQRMRILQDVGAHLLPGRLARCTR